MSCPEIIDSLFITCECVALRTSSLPTTLRASSFFFRSLSIQKNISTACPPCQLIRLNRRLEPAHLEIHEFALLTAYSHELNTTGIDAICDRPTTRALHFCAPLLHEFGLHMVLPLVASAYSVKL